MTREEKLKACFEAVEKGEITAKNIDPVSRGSSFRKAKNGKFIPVEKTVTGWYDNLLQHKSVTQNVTQTRKEKPIKKHKNVTQNTITEPVEQHKIETQKEERIKELENEISELKMAIAAMNERFLKLEVLPRKEKKRITQKIMGFSVGLRKTQSGGYTYKKWYATNKLNGKLVNVYLGESPAGAEEKIGAYLKRREKTC